MDYDISAADLASIAVLGRRRAQRERPQQPRRALADNDNHRPRAVVQARVALGASVCEKKGARRVKKEGARALRGKRGARERGTCVNACARARERKCAK